MVIDYLNRPLMLNSSYTKPHSMYIQPIVFLHQANGRDNAQESMDSCRETPHEATRSEWVMELKPYLLVRTYTQTGYMQQNPHIWQYVV